MYKKTKKLTVVSIVLFLSIILTASILCGCSSPANNDSPATETTGIKTIGDYAFAYCSSLTSVSIPDSVTSIGNYAFAGCSSLTQFIVDGANANYTASADSTMLLSKDGTTLIAWPSASGDVSIPASVTKIGEGAFYECSSLTSVTFADTSTWYYTNNSDYTGGSKIVVTNAATNATYLTTTYYRKYWYKK